MSGETMRLDVTAGIARLTFINAKPGNLMDRRFFAELNDSAIVLTSRADVRAVLISAEGPAFSYGADLSSWVAAINDLPAEILAITAQFNNAIARFQRMNAPVVVAVHGMCTGGMNGFVAGADFVLASETARFAAAYLGIGLNCDGSCTVTLPSRMGMRRARRFMLLNEVLDAASACAAGLVDEVLATDQLAARAEQLVEVLARGPTRAYGEMRRLLLSSHDQPLETQLELEAQAAARLGQSEDLREGIMAFVEKRQPVFHGR